MHCYLLVCGRVSRISPLNREQLIREDTKLDLIHYTSAVNELTLVLGGALADERSLPAIKM